MEIKDFVKEVRKIYSELVDFETSSIRNVLTEDIDGISYIHCDIKDELWDGSEINSINIIELKNIENGISYRNILIVNENEQEDRTEKEEILTKDDLYLKYKVIKNTYNFLKNMEEFNNKLKNGEA